MLNADELGNDLELPRPKRCKAADTGWKKEVKDMPAKPLVLEPCAAPQPNSRLVKEVSDKE